MRIAIAVLYFVLALFLSASAWMELFDGPDSFGEWFLTLFSFAGSVAWIYCGVRVIADER